MFYILAIGQALTKQPIFKVNLVEANPYHKDNIQDCDSSKVFLFWKRALRGETELTNSRSDTIMD